jgi:hypothetical protein
LESSLAVRAPIRKKAFINLKKYIDYTEKGGILPIALGFILFGVLFLLRNLDVIRGNVWDFVWPLVFIIIGISIIFRGMGRSQ